MYFLEKNFLKIIISVCTLKTLVMDDFIFFKKN